MTNDEFLTAINQLWPGHGSQSRAARALDMNTRRVRALINGERSVSADLAAEIMDLLERFPNGIREVDPRIAVATTFEAMREAGWTDQEAAAAILGAAFARATSVMGRDAVRALLE
jgi:hypothetical protein